MSNKSSQESSPITQWTDTIKKALVQHNTELTGYDCPVPLEVVDQLTSATIELMTKIIGEDEQQVWDEDGDWCTKCEFQPSDDTRNCICVYRNELRKQLRQSLKELKSE